MPLALRPTSAAVPEAVLMCLVGRESSIFAMVAVAGATDCEELLDGDNDEDGDHGDEAGHGGVSFVPE